MMTSGTETRRVAAAPERVGLVLSGGGARSAYQIGVLKALADMLPGRANPFPIIVGTSAGGVAAAALAAEAGEWRHAVRKLAVVWSGFTVDQVFRADSGSMIRAGLRWLLAAVSAGRMLRAPRALFDSSPLRSLLARSIAWPMLRENIAAGALHAVALCATSYPGGCSVAYFEAADEVKEWQRARRLGRRTKLGLDHLMASAAIPFLFPAVALEGEYFGDGAMRQLAPLSPAIRLGADRLLILAVRAPHGQLLGRIGATHGGPSPGQIFGFMLDTLFTDQLSADHEQLERLNDYARRGVQGEGGLREIDTLVVAPSVDPAEIAVRHIHTLPRSLRALLGVIGASGAAGGLLASYLMFDGAFASELIALGYGDAMARRAELCEFIAQS